MNYRNFVGIDMSKLWFDAHFLKVDTPKGGDHERFTNDAAGIALFQKRLEERCKAELSDTLVVMEHTGVYTIPLCKHLGSKSVVYTLIAGIEISKSLGLKRGKADKVDSQRIAQYAYKNRDDIRMCSLPDNLLAQLKKLLSFREYVIKRRSGFKVSVNETAAFNSQIDNQFFIDLIKPTLDALKKNIKEIERKMKEIISSDASLKRNYDLLMSIPGIGIANTVAFIVYTGNFILFNDSRKYASYCGIAPFSNGSGKNPGKDQVSHYANKRVKTLLTSGAWSAVRWDAEIKLYFDRQKERGKEEGSVINMIRNKLVHKAFSIIKKGEPYQNRHSFHTI